MTRWVSFLLLALIAISRLGAQDIIYEHYRDGVDLWVMIPYNTLNFKRNSERGSFDLNLEIKNLATKKVLNLEQRLEIDKQDWLNDTALLASFREELAPGKYQALLRLKNRDLGDKTDLKKTFIIEETFTEIGQPYFIVTKNGLRYLPGSLEKLPVPVDKCEIRQRFSVVLDSVRVDLGNRVANHSMPASEYVTDITEIANGEGVPKVEISLFEGNIRYHMSAFLYDQWFAYNARYSYEDQIQQLRYIANQNEWKTLRAVPEDMFAEVIERFWEAHDPTPGTIRNEYRENFSQRVIIADERYTIHKRLQGWSSDRGRIYIKYGDPDETLFEVHPIDLYPYIIWTYYRQNLEFVFTDRGGFGQYRLENKDEEY